MTQQAMPADEGIEYVNVDVEVGILVQSLMFRHRHKQSDLGEILGIGQATVSRKLRGDVAFSLVDLTKIARAYNVDAGDLLPRLDSNQQPCGYASVQVTESRAVAEGEWDGWFDWYAHGLEAARAAGHGRQPVEGRDEEAAFRERWFSWRNHAAGLEAWPL